MYPQIFFIMIVHPQMSMYWGTFCMGFSTIVNATAQLVVPIYANGANLVYALYWINVSFVLICIFGITHLMFTKIKFALENITAVWLLPIVPLVVIAATGSFVTAVVSPGRAEIVLIASYIFWGWGMALSLVVFSLYFYRLTMHKFVPNEVIISSLLPLGPMGK